MHILAASYLNEFIDIMLSRNIKPFNECFMFQLGTRHIVFEAFVKDGLYCMSLYSRRKIKSLKVGEGEDISEAKRWHKRLDTQARSDT